MASPVTLPVMGGAYVTAWVYANPEAAGKALAGVARAPVFVVAQATSDNAQTTINKCCIDLPP